MPETRVHLICLSKAHSKERHKSTQLFLGEGTCKLFHPPFQIARADSVFTLLQKEQKQTHAIQ